MRFHEDASEVYPACAPAHGRCGLCGRQFDFGRIERAFESGESEGDVCEECPGLPREELHERMLKYSSLLYSMAEELEEIVELERSPA